MEEITRSCERVRAFLFAGVELRGGGDESIVVDWEIVSDEHCVVDNGVEDAAAAVGGSRLPSRLRDGGFVGSDRGADEACCSHIARVLGSTGQLEGAESTVFDVGGGGDAGAWEERAGIDVDEGSAGASAFHHPMLCRLDLLLYRPQIFKLRHCPRVLNPPTVQPE